MRDSGPRELCPTQSTPTTCSIFLNIQRSLNNDIYLNMVTIAQLVERLIVAQEVLGSNPSSHPDCEEVAPLVECEEAPKKYRVRITPVGYTG